MPLYGMKRKSETTAYVQKFVTDMNAMGRPHCFRTDNGGEFTSHRYVDYCDSVGILLLRLGRDPSQIHGSGQAATKRGRRECDLALDDGLPCGTSRDSATFSRTSTSPASPTSAPTATVFGWRLPSGLLTVSTAPLPRQTPGGSRRTRCSSRDGRRCRYCLFQHGMMRVVRGTKSDVHSVLCYYLNICLLYTSPSPRD